MSVMTDLTARLPWVTRLARTQACDGYRWSHMPGYAAVDPWLRERYRCRARARWKFTALPAPSEYGFAAQNGTYCWSHLWVQLGHMNEEDRTTQTLDAIRRQQAEDEARA